MCGVLCGVWAEPEAERHSQAKDNAVCVCRGCVCVCGGEALHFSLLAFQSPCSSPGWLAFHQLIGLFLLVCAQQIPRDTYIVPNHLSKGINSSNSRSK